MKCFILLALISSVTIAQTENRDPGLLKGYQALSAEFASRVMDQHSQQFNFIQYINNDKELAALLGTWKSENGVITRVNPHPGPVAMNVYNALFSAFTLELLAVCDVSSKGQLKDGIELNSFFKDLWLKLCKWPDGNVQEDGSLELLFEFIMGFEAPESERMAWKNWVKTEFGSKPASEALPKMVHAILLNPYFLLEN